MSLSKIFHRHNRQEVTPTIQVYAPDETVLSVYRQKIEQTVRKYYHGKETEAKVISEIKKSTGLRAGHITLQYNKRKNLLKVFYCCAPF